MSRAAKYFGMQLKRYFKVFPFVLLLSIILFAAVTLTFSGLFSNRADDEQNSLVRIGIVGNMDDSYLGMAIGALQNLDSSRFSLATEVIDDEDAAAQKIVRGEYVAYIVLPDNFIDEAIHGNVQKITCVTASGATDFGSRITGELMKAITEIVLNSQKAVYGFETAAEDFGLTRRESDKLGTEVAFKVIDTIIAREEAYELREIGTSGVDDIDDPLICGLIVMFLMLWGITCCTVCTARKGALYRILAAKGTGGGVQVAAEYVAYFVFMAATVSVVAVGVFVTYRFLPAAQLFDGLDFGRIFPAVLVPVATISAMQFFIYEISGGLVSGVLLQFVCALGVGYVSGCFYPAFFFPRGVQNAASFLPAWHCRLWLDELLANRASPQTFAVLAAYFAAFLILAALIRRARIKREGGSA